MERRLGKAATYLICSHGDVIKAIVADSLGLHLDQCQRIVADPCSLTVIRYTPLRPFLLRLNDTGGGVEDLLPPRPARREAAGLSRSRDRPRRAAGWRRRRQRRERCRDRRPGASGPGGPAPQS